MRPVIYCAAARTWLMGAAALGLALALGPAARAGGGPEQVVERLHGALAAVMRDAGALGFEGRRERLAPVLAESLDLEAIARIALGRHWEALDDAQRARMVDTFTRLTVATYAARFDGDGGRRFVTETVEPLKRERRLVRTTLRAPDGEAVQLDYVLEARAGGWRIVNVVADGVSDLALKRAEYGAVVADAGFDALLRRLDAQVEDYARGGAR